MLKKYWLKLNQVPPKGNTGRGLADESVVWSGNDSKLVDGYDAKELSSEDGTDYNTAKSWPVTVIAIEAAKAAARLK